MDIRTSISINPTTSTLQTGETTQFTVKSDDNTEAKVKWSATGGAIDSSGLYTAPTKEGTYTVTATNVTDPSQKPSVTVTVKPLGTGDIQATLRWSTVDDLDLELTDPAGARVSFNNQNVPSGGQLDVDANRDCDGNNATPVENIFWPPSGAPRGEYVAGVNLFKRCATTASPIQFTLTLKVQGITKVLTGTVDAATSTVRFPFSFSEPSPLPTPTPSPSAEEL